MQYDIAIVGAGFAGLALRPCRRAPGPARARHRSQARTGERVHTTGLVVKEAAERWEIPAALTRRVTASACIRHRFARSTSPPR
jgi:hypothetical protein